MSAPTYDLLADGGDAGRYLRAVSRVADDLISAGEAIRPLVERYAAFVGATGREPVRSHVEYLLEALTLGVLWRVRGTDALRREGVEQGWDAPYELVLSPPALPDLDRLLTWLAASGEHAQEVARLTGWRAFLDREPPGALADLSALAASFDALALGGLGRFTQRVPDFLRDVLPRRRWREDTVQCARRRPEYHLDMVGAELLNRAWRTAFLRCRRHVVVLPGCMRLRAGAGCRAERPEGLIRCAACAPGCAARAATGVARRAGGEALAVLHGSDLSRALHAPELHGGDVGVVGVACVPGLVAAGWLARAAGLPAQCVPLDRSGCAHWRDDPEPTAVELAELRRILRPARLRVMREAVSSC